MVVYKSDKTKKKDNKITEENKLEYDEDGNIIVAENVSLVFNSNITSIGDIITE